MNAENFDHLAAKIVQNASGFKGSDEFRIAYDIVFLINANSRGWILEKICRIIAENSGLHYELVFVERNDRLTVPLPKAKRYFFAHYSIAYHIMAKYPEVHDSHLYVWFTHYDADKKISLSALSTCFNNVNTVFTANSLHKAVLTSIGIEPDKVLTVLGGADPQMFRPHTRGGGKVGIVGAYYERKQPDKIVELVANMRNTEFLLLAPGFEHVDNPDLVWRNWSGFNALTDLPNLEYVEAEYEEFPAHYERMDVYLSLSTLEGGPIPLIEAMMANVFPVVTRTGFAEDVMTGPLCDFILELDEPVSSVAQKVRAAISNHDTDVAGLSSDLSWTGFGRNISARFNVNFPVGETVRFGHGQIGQKFLKRGWGKPHSTAAATSSAKAYVSVPTGQPGRLLRGEASFRIANRESGPECVPVSLTTNGSATGADGLVGRDFSSLVFWHQASAENDTVCISQESGSLAGGATSLLLSSLSFKEVDVQAQAEWNFSAIGDTAGLLSNDWYPQERSGVWSKSKAASFSIPIDRHKLREASGLELDVRVFGRSANGGVEQVGIKLQSNGSSVDHTIEFGDDEIKRLSFPLADGIRHSGQGAEWEILTIKVFRSQLWSPAEVGTGQDRRKLGVFLKNVRLLTR